MGHPYYCPPVRPINPTVLHPSPLFQYRGKYIGQPYCPPSFTTTKDFNIEENT
jgi:hypothetical protein